MSSVKSCEGGQAGLVRSAMARPLLLTAAGLLGGLVISQALAGLVEPLLFGVAPRDPLLLGGVGGVVVGGPTRRMHRFGTW